MDVWKQNIKALCIDMQAEHDAEGSGLKIIMKLGLDEKSACRFSQVLTSHSVLLTECLPDEASSK